MDDSSISRKENGKTQIKPDEQQRFADAFGIELRELLDLCQWTDGRGVKPRGIPLIGPVPAGNAVVVHEHDQGGVAEKHDPFAEIDWGQVGDPDAFACRVKGDSMHPAIRHGDLCVFTPVFEDKPASHPKAGDVVFIQYNEDSPIKGCCLAQWFPGEAEGTWLLVKINSKFAPRTIRSEWVATFGLLIEHRKTWVV